MNGARVDHSVDFLEDKAVAVVSSDGYVKWYLYYYYKDFDSKDEAKKRAVSDLEKVGLKFLK